MTQTELKTDYTALDIAAHCNCGVEVYAAGNAGGDVSSLFRGRQPPPIGAQTFHGLPFQIGPAALDEARCLIGFGGALGAQSVTVPVGQVAHYVIVAHALLETGLWRGGPLGEVIARYTFHLAGGEVVCVPIRERFEISTVPFAFGQKPFLCVSDQSNFMYPREGEPWQQAGFRLTETGWGAPRGYYLWAWRNPRPEAVIERVEIAPGGRLFVVAGLTLGLRDEFPFVREARRPVRVERGAAAEAGDGPLAVEVDRGVATYAHPLPADPPGPDMAGYAGFGAPFNGAGAPAYVEVAGLPSATLTVKQGERVLGQANWGELNRQGSVRLPGARLEVLGPEKNWVQVNVVDDATGQPLPCRVAFLSPEGVPYAPHGHHAPLFDNINNWNLDVGGDLRLGQITYAYTDGTCQGWLPRGRVLVDAAAGFEYVPQRGWREIAPGQQRLEVRLRRWVDMNAAGWWSGDTHVHFLSTQGAVLEAQGEGLNVVNLLQSQWGHLFTNTEEFTGAPLVARDGRTVVYASQENRQHILGHLTLLGLKRAVMPWCSGGPSEAELGGGLDVTLSHWADACHEQGGTVVIPHLGVTNGEAAALIATRRADAIEMLTHGDYLHHEYYRYLNGGYRLPLVGGTDKMDSQVPVGLYRTYVQLPDGAPFSYEAWCAGLRAGRTFLSGGALVWLEVEGRGPGDTLKVPAGGTVEVTARAQSIFPLGALEVVMGGEVVAASETASETDGLWSLAVRARVRVGGDTWLAARCAGKGYGAVRHFDSWQRGVMAHTSPVYVTTGGAAAQGQGATLEYMLTAVDGSLSYIRELSLQHRPAWVTHHHGEADHQAYLERPFLEARDELHRRLHALGLPH